MSTMTDAEIMDVAEPFGEFRHGDAQGSKRIAFARAVLAAAADELERAQEAKDDGLYLERNRCVALIARLALQVACRVSVTKTAIAGWSDDWHNCVYIELPTGQVSWHFHDSHAHLFDGLPREESRMFGEPMKWDGHDTSEKYRRVDAAYA